MYSSRENAIIITNGVVVNTNINKKNTHLYIQEDLYKDPFEETRKEWKRIKEYVSKPCPDDFPKKLKPYWKGHLEFSMTPCQSGWMYLEQLKKKKV